MSPPPVQTELADGVLLITLDRPAHLNALTLPMLGGLAAVLESAQDASVRAVVLTGAGRGFCAGQDLDEVLADPGNEQDRLRTGYHPVITALDELGKPTIAAVNGICAGAGIALASACDIRIASPTTSFKPAFIDLALVPDAGASSLLIRLIGYGATLEWLLSGRRLDAHAAQALGLVQEIVEDSALVNSAIDRATALAQQPATALALTKRLVREATRNPLSAQLELEAATQARATADAEHRARLKQLRRARGKRTDDGG